MVDGVRILIDRVDIALTLKKCGEILEALTILFFHAQLRVDIVVEERVLYCL